MRSPLCPRGKEILAAPRRAVLAPMWWRYFKPDKVGGFGIPLKVETLAVNFGKSILGKTGRKQDRKLMTRLKISCLLHVRNPGLLMGFHSINLTPDMETASPYTVYRISNDIALILVELSKESS